MTDETKSDGAAFAAKAKDLDALHTSLVDAASVSVGLWISYLFVLFYLLIAAGGVTHRDLLLENPIKLPFLNVELPLIGFFFLAPLLFLIVHVYVLVHFVLLADKIGAFHAELATQIPDDDVRARLRRQLPSNIFVQFLAGPHEVRTGIVGFLLRMIAQISLVAAPLALLIFILFQFLPYHHEEIAWWQRLAIVADLALLWTLWPGIARGQMTSITLSDLRRGKIATSTLASVAVLVLVFGIATFPGEHLDLNPFTLRFIPRLDPSDGSLRLISAHDFLLAGDIDFVARKPTSLWSNRLVLPGFDAIDRVKFDTDAKIDAASETLSLRGRRLEAAVLIGAKLRKIDFTAARLTGAFLDRADLRSAKFECAARAKIQGKSPDESASEDKGEKVCARLEGATLASAQLQGTLFKHAHLEGASLDGAQMQGAFLESARLQGATLDEAQLEGALLDAANLQGASLLFAQLFGTSLRGTDLQGTRFNGSQLQGAALATADAEGASFDRVFVWRADPRAMGFKGISVIGPATEPKFRLADDCPDDTCDWSPRSYAALKARLEQQIPKGENRDRALQQIASLDPANELADEKEMGNAWLALEQASATRDSYSDALTVQLQTLGCDAATGPYVIRGLLRGVLGRPASNGPHQAVLAGAFLDEKQCAGARRLSDEDKETLRKMRDGVPSKSSPDATTAPKH